MPKQIAAERFEKWVVVGLLWVVACLNYTDRLTIFTIFPAIKKEMGLSDVVLGLLGSTFLWTYAASSPLCGYLGDRFNRKSVILWSLAIFSLVTFATGFARSGSQLIILRILLGVSEALFLPTALAHIATFHTDSTRSLANAIALSGLKAGAGVGAFYGGYMADYFTWRVGFYILGIVGGLLCLVLWGVLPGAPRFAPGCLPPKAEPPRTERISKKVGAVLSVPTAACLIFLSFALSLTSWPLGSWGPTYLHEQFGMSLTKSGANMAIFVALPMFMGGVLGGLWADRWARSNPKARLKVQLAGLGFMAPTMAAFGFVPTAIAWDCNFLVYSLADGALEVNSMPVFSTVMPSTRWATAYGLYNLAGTLAGSLGVLFVGIMKKTWGIAYSMSFMSVLLFAAIVVIAFATSRFVVRDMRRHMGSGG